MRLAWRQARPVDYELVFGGVLAACFLGLALVPPERLLERVGYRCPFRTLTRLPCPTCRGTRALAALRRLQVAEAFRLNPLVAAGALGAVFYVPYAAATVALRARRLRLVQVSRRDEWLLRVLVVAAVLANWAYLLATW